MLSHSYPVIRAPYAWPSGSVTLPGVYFGVDRDSGFYRIGADNWALAVGAVNALELSTTALVVNEGGADRDFRVESDTNANMLVVDAGQNHAAYGGASRLDTFLVLDAGAETTAQGEFSKVQVRNGAAITTNTGNTAVYALQVAEPNITVGTATPTNGVTLYIPNAPTEATNNYALWVDSGSSRLDGSLWVESTPTEGAAGEQLTSGGTGAVMTWDAAASTIESKRNIRVWDSPGEALRAILGTPIYRFNYKAPADRDGYAGLSDLDTEYVGPLAHEAPWAMHYGGRILNPINTFGYLALSIQALHEEITALHTRLAAAGV